MTTSMTRLSTEAQYLRAVVTWARIVGKRNGRVTAELVICLTILLTEDLTDDALQRIHGRLIYALTCTTDAQLVAALVDAACDVMRMREVAA